MTGRQEAFYVDVVDIYKPTTVAAGVNQQAKDRTYPGVATVASVPCKWETKAEVASPSTGVGRSNIDNMLTVDIFHFESDVDVRDSYYLQLITPGHPENGSWFIVQGDPQIKNWRARKLSVYAKKGLPPT